MLQISWQLGAVVLQTLIIYTFLILLLSLTGTRQASEPSVIELVIIMVLGSSVETSLIAGNTSLLAGLTSATTLLFADRIVNALQTRFPRLRGWLAGRVILLVHNGQLLPDHLRAAAMTRDDVLEGIRELGYEHLDQVRYAVLERDGSISVIPRDSR